MQIFSQTIECVENGQLSKKWDSSAFKKEEPLPKVIAGVASIEILHSPWSASRRIVTWQDFEVTLKVCLSSAVNGVISFFLSSAFKDCPDFWKMEQEALHPVCVCQKADC